MPGAVHLDPETDLSSDRPRSGRRGPPSAPTRRSSRRIRTRRHRTTDFVLAIDDGWGFAARCWWLLRHLGHDAAGTLDIAGYAGPLSPETVEPAPPSSRRDRAPTTDRPPRRSSPGSATRGSCSSTRAAASLARRRGAARSGRRADSGCAQRALRPSRSPPRHGAQGSSLPTAAPASPPVSWPRSSSSPAARTSVSTLVRSASGAAGRATHREGTP